MKHFITNRHGLKIAVLVEIPEQPAGLAFVMHGLTGYKEQNQIQTAATAFFKKGYIAIRFDTTHSTGESEGSTELCSPTTYYEDLCDVIDWASKQNWYRKKFVLFGTSLGGLCCGRYAEQYPEKVGQLILHAPLLSGVDKLEHEQKNNPQELEKWRSSGWSVRVSLSRPGTVSKIPWSYMEDLMHYDLFADIGQIRMPTLILINEKDKSVPIMTIRSWYDKLTTRKEIPEIKGAGHNLYNAQHLEALEKIITNWLGSIA